MLGNHPLDMIAPNESTIGHRWLVHTHTVCSNLVLGAFVPEHFVFHDLRDLLAKANEEKSGDHLAGVAARSERERVAAKRKLADLPLAEIVQQPLIDPCEDEVSRLLLETYDQEKFKPIESMTVGEFREYILDDA